MDEKSPADILEDAADALWMYGRCIGSVLDGERMCALGAIQYAADPNRLTDFTTSTVCIENNPEAVIALAASIPDIDPLTCELPADLVAGRRIFMWNDSLRPSPENDAEVIDTLRRCAKDLRNKAGER